MQRSIQKRFSPLSSILLIGDSALQYGEVSHVCVSKTYKQGLSWTGRSQLFFYHYLSLNHTKNIDLDVNYSLGPWDFDVNTTKTIEKEVEDAYNKDKDFYASNTIKTTRCDYKLLRGIS